MPQERHVARSVKALCADKCSGAVLRLVMVSRSFGRAALLAQPRATSSADDFGATRYMKPGQTGRRLPFGSAIELSSKGDDYTTAAAATLLTWLTGKFGDNQRQMCGTSEQGETNDQKGVRISDLQRSKNCLASQPWVITRARIHAQILLRMQKDLQATGRDSFVLLFA